MWKSNEDPFDLSQEAQWTSYSDVQDRIIEDAYREKMSHAVLDDYHIDFEHLIQISDHDKEDQRPIVQNILNADEMKRLRQQRFIDDELIVPSKPYSRSHLYSPFISERRKDFAELEKAERLAVIVEEAANGLITEGKLLGKQKEGEYLAKRLLEVKYGAVESIYQVCLRIYTLDSFLYRKLNEIMRLAYEEGYENIWKCKVATLSPFAYLLFMAVTTKNRDFGNSSARYLYRGGSLSEAAIEQWNGLHELKSKVNSSTGILYAFPSFVSASTNRVVAECFSHNVIYEMINFGTYIGCGRDISLFSRFEDEEEFLLRPGIPFKFESCKFDTESKKWIIKLDFTGLFVSF